MLENIQFLCYHFYKFLFDLTEGIKVLKMRLYCVLIVFLIIYTLGIYWMVI
jgi:hypothetical protein